MTHESIIKIQEKIWYEFDRPAYLEQAFDFKDGANDTLIFYGQSVFDNLIAIDMEKYYEVRNPEKYISKEDPMRLKAIRKKLAKPQNKIASITFWKLHSYLDGFDSLDNKSKRRMKRDLFDAILGAIFVDCHGGFFKAKWQKGYQEMATVAYERIAGVHDMLLYGIDDHDYLLDLERKARNEHLILRHETVKDNNPEHCQFHQYVCYLHITGIAIDEAVGQGRTRKEALNSACQSALQHLTYKKPFSLQMPERN